MRSPYDTSKITQHPEALAALRAGKTVAPIFVQIFPTNACNESCSFCSYGHWAGDQGPAPSQWKNHQQFLDRDHLSRDKMRETIACLATMGTKAIEVSGGGEPTVYPWFNELIGLIGEARIEVALVSNGVLLDDRRADLLAAASFIWARISIDAGDAETYAATRHCPPDYFERAFAAVQRLAQRKRHPEARVGVGYVIDRGNTAGIYAACQRARDAGADNIRISVAFTPEGSDRWTPAQKAEALEGIARAKADFESATFEVADLAGERWGNLVNHHQQYPYCYWKDVACVIGADANIYACCSWAYNKMGLIGSIREQSFEQFWFSPDATVWRQRHDPRFDCRIHCLYEKRNKEALGFIVDPEAAEAARAAGVPLHRNFV